MNNNDLYYINTAKVLGIILMLLGHLPVCPDLYIFILSFHMPLFFFISGFLFTKKKDSIKTFLLHKTRTLVIPFLFFAVISIILSIKNLIAGTLSYEQYIKYLIGLFYAPASGEYLGFNAPLWFLPSLFVAEALFFLFLKYFNKKYVWLCSVLCFILGIIVKETFTFRLPWAADTALFSVIFVYIGYIIRKKDILNKYFIDKPLNIKIFTVAITLCLTIILAKLNGSDGSVSLYSLRFNNYILYIINALLGCAFIITLSITLPPNKIFNFYGRNTIVILGFHLLIFSWIKIIDIHLFNNPIDASNFLSILLYLFITMVISIPIIIFINKYMPFFIGRKKKVLQ